MITPPPRGRGTATNPHNRFAPSRSVAEDDGWYQEVADVVSFIRGSWGNKGAPVGAKDVANLRSNDMETMSPNDLGQVTEHH